MAFTVVKISIDDAITPGNPIIATHAGNFYCTLSDGSNAHVFKSTDGGNTWTEQDAAHAPAGPENWFLNGTTKLTLAISQGVSGFQLIDFSMVSDTWGSTYASSGAESGNVQQGVVQSSGNIVVFYSVPALFGGPAQKYGVWNGVSWTFNSIQTAAFPNTFQAICVLQSTDVVHLLVSRFLTGVLQTLTYYQVSAGGSLSAGNNITSVLTGANASGGNAIAIDEVNGNLLLGSVDLSNNRPNVLIGANLTTPVWSVTGDISSAIFSVGDQIVQLIAGTLYYACADLTGAPNQIINVLTNPSPSTPGSGWSLSASYATGKNAGGPRIVTSTPADLAFLGASTYIIIGAPAPPPVSTPINTVVGGLPAGVVSAIGARGPQMAPYVGPAAQFSQGLAPAPADSPFASPYGFNTQPSPRPQKNIGGTCLIRNWWDECLEMEAQKLRLITFPRLCAIPEEYNCLLPWDDDFGAIPPGAIPINPRHGIVTPATAAGDTVFLTYGPVPVGYDGIITGFFWNYSGTGFSQGSGDLVFRMQVNQRWVKDLSNVLFALGSPQLPIPMTDGQILLSGQTVRLVVNVANLSGLIQVGASTIFGGLMGFLWSR